VHYFVIENETIRYFSSDILVNLTKNYGDIVDFRSTPKITGLPSDIFRDLDAFRWKPVLIAKELREHPAVFWMDCSILPKMAFNELIEIFKNCPSPYKCQFYPWFSLSISKHSIFAATHPEVCY